MDLRRRHGTILPVNPYASQLGDRNAREVIAETEVPDWHWTTVLHDLRRLERPPHLIITSRHADDRLWAEALNVGAYDVLAQPLDRVEVERAVESAHRHFEVRPMEAGRLDLSAGAA